MQLLGGDHCDVYALHLHGSTDLIIRTRESDVGGWVARAVIAGDVVVARGDRADEVTALDQAGPAKNALFITIIGVYRPTIP
jgi:hypothetical protein